MTEKEKKTGSGFHENAAASEKRLPSPFSLEAGLKGLSWWEGRTPGVWKKALAELGQGETETPSRIHRIVRSRWSWVGVPIAAVILVGIVLPWADGMGPFANEPSRYSPKVSSDRLATSAAEVAMDEALTPNVFMKLQSDVAAGGRYGDARKADGQSRFAYAWNDSYSGSLGSKDGNDGDDARHVIRKAALDLRTSDVRGVYLKVRKMVVNTGAGEFVEGAEIHGDEQNARGYVTLRVAQGRLSAVLEQIREMAEVVREQTDSTDVTETVVDLAARLRNERRVEEELLELMASRDDAPLKEVLELRERLSEVRGEIERLAGQSQRLGKQVAMATVVVTIHHQAGPEPKESSLLEYFQDTMAGAWYDGVGGLIHSVAKVMRVLIGGAVWWIGFGALGLAGRRWYLRWREAQALAA